MTVDNPNFIYDNWAYNNSSASQIVPYVIDRFKPKSVIDIGCGTGSWLSVFKSKGVKSILGVDSSIFNQSCFSIEESEYQKIDLSTNVELDKKYDLAISLEVGEHIEESCSDTFIDNLCNASDLILFSAAIPGQGGQMHINEQWPDYWINKFFQRGFEVDDSIKKVFWTNKKIHWWYRQNVLIFKRTTTSGLSTNLPTNLVHPELFEYRNSEIALYKSGIIGVKSAFKMLINAVIYKIFKKSSFLS
ncbi:Methyltransferase domain-containing protein [Reichenbachiella faecimaris]|uniref:Methyltransferase domain-containing protein n=1 Tax=Reichenbachiella faecimaris TaxID=692418 RepID=A0A1W2GII5_REIFA|nr:methyltransferase domain-containing protein [Reichenbachiella faecimaris]SMD36479.1 Methyltransferase domain-containing protein [Reichenbachiella faecimaris]